MYIMYQFYALIFCAYIYKNIAQFGRAFVLQTKGFPTRTRVFLPNTALLTCIELFENKRQTPMVDAYMADNHFTPPKLY